MVSEEIMFRAPVPADLGFVLKSWIRSYANSAWAGAISRERLVAAIKGTITDLIARGAVVVIACSRRRPEVIYGFACYELGYPWPVIHYVFVKALYQGMDIGKALAAKCVEASPSGDIRFTHKTPDWDRVLPRSAKFVPNLARYPRRKPKESDAANSSPAELRGDPQGL